ncbi:MAG TPA: protein kinase [Polyangiaceae bacterium]|nr:protein kinase [Polyangiaceae bacterium]
MATPSEVVIGGRYRLGTRLGRGGMGEVFAARDLVEDRDVALKRMTGGAGEEAVARLRFRREFHVLASLRHPRIIGVYDFGSYKGSPFYTMELLDGSDLKDVGVLGPVEACKLLRDVAAALAMIHARGLVHRDLSAKNVRRLASGRAKLMDFGVLANFGTVGDVAGTPQYLAPEGFREMPVDGRTDLYSLGVLAYVILTGRAPYQAKGFKEIALAWGRAAPRPPSAYAPGPIPHALDELVMALLSFEPSGRPGTAAEVIARLGGIGQLPDEADLDVRSGYLASAPLVGRDAEIDAAREAIASMHAGTGATWVVRAESGSGKSRLLREIALEAKVSGAIVASVSCATASPRPLSSIDQIASALFKASPATALEAAGESLGVLSRVLPALARHAPQRSAAPAQDPGEERLRVQRAIGDFLLALATRSPLLLAIDDVQRCDEASLAALAAVARQAPESKLMLVATVRSGEEVRAPAALRALERESTTLALAGLSESSMGHLVRALFGDVANASRLASQLSSSTGGSPMHAVEVVRALVEDGTVQYKGGLWVIPADVRIDRAPQTLADAMDAGVAALPREARALGEALAVAGGESSLELIADLAAGEASTERPRADSSGGAVDATLASLDKLSEAGFLVADGERYRFRHDSAREALLRGIGPERRATLARRVGARLLQEPDADARDAEIGFLLVEGGELQRGAELLARAGTRLFEAQALADCIAPLEAAVAAQEKLGARRGKTMGLRAMLLAAGWVSDRATGSRHAYDVVRDFREQTGVALAHRLRGLGKPLALLLGVMLATIRWFFASSETRGPSPLRAMPTFALSLSYAVGLANAENRKDDLAALVELVEPFGVFRGRVPWAIHLVTHAMPDILYGRLRSAAERLTEALPIFRADRLALATEDERAFAEAGVRGLRVLVDVNQLDPRVHEDCDAIDALGFRYWRLVVQATKVVHHRYRGEEERAVEIQRTMEIPSIQLGSWSTDIQVLVFSHPAYALCHDVLGLERCIAAFERLIPQGFRYETRLAITRGEWHRERGNPAAAVEVLEPAYASVEAEDLLMRQWLGSGLAEALLAAGRHEHARRVADEVIAVGDGPEGPIVMPRIRCRRIAALATAGLGDSAKARSMLLEALAEAETLDFPPLAGDIHEGLARLAIANGDVALYRGHATEMMRWLKPTANAALIGFAERLLEAGKAAGEAVANDPETPTLIDTARDSGPKTHRG